MIWPNGKPLRNALLAAGILPRERMLMIVKDCPEFVYLYYGAIKAGIVPVPINTLLRAKTTSTWSRIPVRCADLFARIRRRSGTGPGCGIARTCFRNEDRGRWWHKANDRRGR